jgi:CheY-like chemotaxis protein
MVEERILIVEDERITAKALMDLIKKINYIPLEPVATGAAALEAVAKFTPDLILMDIVLEGEMDGIETARRIMDQYQIPIIFITAYGDSETIDRAKLVGPYSYLVKPIVDEREIKPAIELAISNHRRLLAQQNEAKKFQQIKAILDNQEGLPVEQLRELMHGDSSAEGDTGDVLDMALLEDGLDALSNDDRFILVNVLREQQLNMNEVQDLLRKTQSTSSHHLKKLESARLIQGIKQGKFTLYSLDRENLKKLRNHWMNWVKTIENWAQ